MKTCTALILEDSRTQAQIIGRMIESHGWTTVHCESVREVTDTLKLMKIDAMFLDIFVGEHNSILHVERFRKLAPNVPMLLMTAGSSRECIEQTLASARKVGADHVLRKPFNDVLLADVLGALGFGSAPKPRHVLVIEDSSVVRKIACDAFVEAGYRVSQAGTMEGAFSDVDIAHVDLVLCDIFMPGMGGLQGMRMIKTTWPTVKIIAMSAGIAEKVSDIDAINAARRIGAHAQLRKPFTRGDLTDLALELLAA